MEEIKNFIKTYRCYGVIFIAAINIIWFLYMTVTKKTYSNEGMLACGAMLSDVLETGNYEQIFTAFFVHFDITHLCNNMVMLIAMGAMLENHTGTKSFLIIYMLSGIGGNIISAYWHTMQGQIVISAGASGAIFGIVGGFLAAIILNKGRIKDMTTKKLIIFAALSIYQGFANPGTDNAAHVGGFICGFLAAAVCEIFRKVSGVKHED